MLRNKVNQTWTVLSPCLALALVACGDDGGSTTQPTIGTQTSADTSGSGTASTGETTDPSETGGGPLPSCDSPDTTPFMGGLRIETMADVDLITNKTAITGNLEISSLPGFTDVDFLACLEDVGGELNIFGNPDLTDLDGLVNLKSIGTTLSIADNDALTNIRTMDGVTEVDNLSMNNNDALTAITGLKGLANIHYAFTMRYNAVLSNIDGLTDGCPGMCHLLSIGDEDPEPNAFPAGDGGRFDVVHNPELCIQDDLAVLGDGIITSGMHVPLAIDWMTGNNPDC